ncbi:MAG: bifunctional phosphoribosyl-AMP cyclohydrolase/phosphoribosyl-ATP diphosphatase HisIE [Lachnospiraceae bacterium]|nr:bifunctional phosphoribosyl-AMP cyclohydrolase/phosphoribosyl-ATP diphosphatase HisIE [Lachnospiraceae bacterium]
MDNRELIVPFYLKNGKVVSDIQDRKMISDDAAALAASCENSGADALLLFDLSEGDAEHDQSIGMIKKISRATDLPLYGGGNIRRLEDVKKLIYAGCRKIFLNYAKKSDQELTAEASARFGRDRMLACIKTPEELQAANEHAELLDGVLLLEPSLLESALTEANTWETVYCLMGHFDTKAASELFSGCLPAGNGATGVFCNEFLRKEFPFMEVKHALRSNGIAVNTFEASLGWEEIRTDRNGLLPVVVQDYRTLEVLMVAYMNEEAYRTTIRTGRMTYWSRSRQELWVKGLTSGHFQYVRELAIDCDNDTLLAKVVQVGAACHTGNRSCFYRTVLKKEYDSSNPLKVFEDVFAVIEDRKVHPKEGSYTNYLFDKGIDKILKKVGEEATEIIIAAKNPDPEEVVYEISDFLYHVMVLMSERGLTWEDITEELAKR